VVKWLVVAFDIMKACSWNSGLKSGHPNSDYHSFSSVPTGEWTEYVGLTFRICVTLSSILIFFVVLLTVYS